MATDADYVCPLSYPGLSECVHLFMHFFTLGLIDCVCIYLGFFLHVFTSGGC